MNIIVCVKQTPETTEVELSLDLSGKKVKTENLVYAMNEWDEYAIEEALLIKERQGGSVTVVTLGPEGADAVLRRCLAKGADKAIWLRDDAFEGSDAYATAKILYAAIKGLDFDLVFTGVQASDDGYSAVGVILAEFLGVPHASMVKKVEIHERICTVNRELEGGLEEVIELSLPAVITIQTGINEPRYVSIMGIRRARIKEIKVLRLGDLELSKMDVGEIGSWIRTERVYRPLVEKEAIIMGGSPNEITEKLVEMFKSRGIV